MRWIALSIAGLIFLPGIAKANVFDLINQESRINSTIDSTTKFLLKRWASNEELNKHQPPQVLPLAAGTKVYGACGERVTGDEVAGSSYCSHTNTIYLVPEQLKYFDDAFGTSAVAYVIAHEFGHATQKTFEFRTIGASKELQADCLAGVFIKEGSQELNINPNDVIAMSSAAHSIGSESHGTGKQRAYALLSGMGYENDLCTNKEMQKLADGIKDSLAQNAFKKVGQTRSIGGKTYTNSSPAYPKSITSALGI